MFNCPVPPRRSSRTMSTHVIQNTILYNIEVAEIRHIAVNATLKIRLVMKIIIIPTALEYYINRKSDASNVKKLASRGRNSKFGCLGPAYACSVY